MKKIAVLLATMFFMVLQVLHAQNQISGTVTSEEDGSTLPGVTVQVKGDATTGTVTDLDGVYQISVPEGAQALVFSFVGMKTVEVPIGGRTVIDVVLELDITELETVVVVGYGVQAKEAITGSVGVIKSEDLKDAPVASIDKVLQGNVAGVFVTSGSGAPGSQTNVRIRGVGSINAGTEPLYVVDGVPINSGSITSLGYSQTSNVMSSINPDDIESVSILKDASSSAIYGSRAANGVVLITTKSGKAGKTKFNFKTQVGFTTLSDKDYPMCNAREFLTLKREAVENAGREWRYATIGGEANPYYLPDSLANVNTNWWDEVTRMGVYQKYQIEARGGSDKMTFYTSAEYHANEGAIVATNFERISARLNLDYDDKEKVSFSMRLAPSYSYGDRGYEGFAYESPIIAASTINPFRPVFNPDGTYNNDMPENGDVNPLAIANLTEKSYNTFRLLSKASAQYKILPYLSLQHQLSADYVVTNERDWRSRQTKYGASDNGPLSRYMGRDILWTSTTMLNFNKVINDIHNVEALVAYEVTKETYDYFDAYGRGTTDNNRYLDAASENLDVGENLLESAMLSYFSRVGYSYNGKYYINASVRRDGSSKFGPDKKWATFWSVGTRWRISEEAFMQNIGQVNTLTLRASYGTTGNSSIGRYEQFGVYGNTIYNGTTGTYPDRFANPELRWEKSGTLNLALEFGVFERFQGTVEYYNKKTEDMLFDISISQTSGLSSMRRNVGSMRNSGIEAVLSSQNIKGTLNWNTDLNVAIPKNEIIDLGAGDSIAVDFIYRPQMRIKGQPVAVFYPYDYAGVNPSNGNPMWYDENGNLTEEFTEARRRNVGDAQPDFIGGITNSISYKGFDLSFQFYFVYNIMMMNQYRRYMEDDFISSNNNKTRYILNRWQNPGDITDVPRQVLDNDSNGGAYGNSRLVTRGDYIRLRDISLTYNFPETILDKVNLESLQVFARGTNLWTRHIAPAMDPEVDSDGISTGNHPNTKTITFGLNIGF